MKKYDFVVVGGGIVGLTTALEITCRRMGSVAVFEKETVLGMHSSGRNSGVIHAGIYYTPGSLKAHLCVSGAKRLWDYAEEKKLPHQRIGKVIVTTREDQLSILNDLSQRAKANGVRVELLDEKGLNAIEPHARTVGKALYSPDTAVIDPKTVLKALAEDITRLGGHVFYDSKVLHIDAAERQMVTNCDVFQYGHLVNAAGLDADSLAHRMGVGLKYRILPFKGAYKKIAPNSPAQFRGLVYPTPDPQLPFLGVHITKNVYGVIIFLTGRKLYGLFWVQLALILNLCVVNVFTFYVEQFSAALLSLATLAVLLYTRAYQHQLRQATLHQQHSAIMKAKAALSLQTPQPQTKSPVESPQLNQSKS